MDIQVKKNTFEVVYSAPEGSCKARDKTDYRAVADEPRMMPCPASRSYINGNGGAALAAATHKPIANINLLYISPYAVDHTGISPFPRTSCHS